MPDSRNAANPTLAAFLGVIDRLVREAEGGRAADTTAIVYVSPLKALGNGIHRNLEAPLSGIARELERLGSGDSCRSPYLDSHRRTRV